MPWKSGAAYSCPIPAFAPNSEPKEMFQCRSFDTIADLLSAGHCPWVLHLCTFVFLYFCFAVCLYFCISGLAPLLISWSFGRFSVWGPEVRLSCRDGGQGGSLGGRRLRRGPGGHLSWGEILVATCFEVIFLLPHVLRWVTCKRMQLLRGSDYFFGQSSRAQFVFDQLEVVNKYSYPF